jgi:hypothetical protein
VFGAPNAADGAQLVIILAGDYRSKKEIAYLFVPAIGRKAYDMGGNVEKGASGLLSSIELCAILIWPMLCAIVSVYVQAHWQLDDSRVPRSAHHSSDIELVLASSTPDMMYT